MVYVAPAVAQRSETYAKAPGAVYDRETVSRDLAESHRILCGLSCANEVSHAINIMFSREADLQHRIDLAGNYLHEIRTYGEAWSATGCAAHAFLALGNAIRPPHTGHEPKLPFSFGGRVPPQPIAAGEVDHLKLLDAVRQSYRKNAERNLPASMPDDFPVQLLCTFRLGDLRDLMKVWPDDPMAQLKAALTVSGNIAGVGYDEAEQEMRVAYRGGHKPNTPWPTWSYENVPPAIWREFLDAVNDGESIGTFIHHRIKSGVYVAKKLTAEGAEKAAPSMIWGNPREK